MPTSLRVCRRRKFCYPRQKLPDGFQATSANITRLNSWQFAADAGAKLLTEYFGCQDLHGFGLDGKEHEAAVGAAGALLNYIRLTQNLMPQHLDGISLETDSQYIGMDAATRRNLEITQTSPAKNRRPCFPYSTAVPPTWAAASWHSGYTTPYAAAPTSAPAKKLLPCWVYNTKPCKAV